MNLRSNTVAQLRSAIAEGNRLYALDTATDGEDDVLYGMDRQEVVNDILFHHDLAEWSDRWTLEEISLAEIEDIFP